VRSTQDSEQREASHAQFRSSRLLAVLMIFLAGCSVPTVLPAGPASPTVPPAADTAKAQQASAVAETESAALTTPTALPTSTVVPTSTPTMTATITTTPFLSGGPGNLTARCVRSPANGTHVSPRERFDVG
jgi:hypothetical protein